MSIPDRIMAALKGRGFEVTGSGDADGIIVTLAIPQDLAGQLAVPGGEDPAEMHVTLAYLGKSSELTEADLPRYLKLATDLRALAHHGRPVVLLVSGPGRFPGANDGMDACIANVESADTMTLREQVMRLCDEAGTPGSRRHPNFHPHITLAYTYPEEDHPRPTVRSGPVEIPDLQLWIGGRHVAFPFGSVLSKADADSAQGALDTQQARAMLARLTGDLITVHRDERQARTQTDRVRAHHSETVDRLAQVIRYPRGSAVEDALMDHAREARAARVLSDQ